MPNKLVLKMMPALLSLLGIIACNLLTSAAPPIALSSPTPSPLPPAPLPTSPSATASPPPSLPPTSAPPTTAPAPTAPPTSTLVFRFDELAPYRRAMLPDFVEDIDSVAETGASQYELEVKLNAEDFEGNQGLRLEGAQKVRYTNTEDTPLDAIYFRLYPNLPGYGGQMRVTTVTVDNQTIEPILESDNSALRVPLAQALPPEAVIDISLTYTAIVPSLATLSYNVFSYNDRTAALAGFYPAIAVYDDEGWNIEIPPPYGDATYLDVSLYQVQLTVPEQMVVAASGSLLTSRSNSDGTKTLTLASGPMRDFYLAMRPDFQVISETVDSIVVNSYYLPGLENGGQLALRYAVDSLRTFNQRFGLYPYAEFDVVATPTTAGGVEYPGIVVIAQGLYHQPNDFFQHATAHEVAHQWWYGLVGNDQVDEPWLDESLTNYNTVLYWEEVAGPASAESIIAGFFMGPYEQARDHGQDRAVIAPVADFSQIEYGIFVYGKGPLFFHALRQEVGDETYFKIMQTYYHEYKYKIANSADLLAIIERVSGRNIEPLVETWLQDNP